MNNKLLEKFGAYCWRIYKIEIEMCFFSVGVNEGYRFGFTITTRRRNDLLGLPYFMDNFGV